MNKRVLLLVVAAAVVAAAAAFLLPLHYLLRFFLDDSYFYMKIAANLARGFGSSFDTINSTNGYHPLWLLLLAGYYKLLLLFTGYSPEHFLRFTFLLIGGINVVSVYCLYRLFSQMQIWQWQRFLLSSLLLTPLLLFFVIGLESQLSVLLIVAWLASYTARAQTNYAAPLRAVLAGLLILCRLDLTALLLPGMLLLEYRQQANTLRFRFSVAFPFVIAVAYLLVNYAWFGILGSVSSRIEFYPTRFLLLQNIPLPLREPIETGLFIAALLPAFVLIHNRKTVLAETVLGLPAIVLYCCSLLFIAVHYMFNIAGAKEWYYAYPHLFGGIIIALAGGSPKWFKRATAAAAAVVLLFFLVFRGYYYEASDALRYANILKQTVPAGGVVYQVDYSGLIGYFSERNVVNGDGLVNSPGYYKALANGTVQQYLNQHPFGWYSTYTYTAVPAYGVFTDSLFTPGGARFSYPVNSIAASAPKIYGGLFRKKYGTFLLFKTENP